MHRKSSWFVSGIAPLLLSLSSPLLWASAPAPSLIAHEWGTFTSLQDSSGQSIEGLYHSDEGLPEFVHSRLKEAESAMLKASKSPSSLLASIHCPSCGTKGVEFKPLSGTPRSVTQKMETPVIYFYSPVDQNVQVDVDFPGGLITQWYPQASSFSPPVGEASTVSGGHIHWDAAVSSHALTFPGVEPGSIWLPSRQTHSNSISAENENEKMIFYRGLGHFDTGLKIVSTASGGLQLRNATSDAVADAFLISVSSQGGSITPLGSVPAAGSIDIAQNSLSQTHVETLETYVAHAKSLISAALVRSGLYGDESQAMVETWAKSYFRTPGLRVLYVLPRSWTDGLLPLRIQPQPKELVRTLVGRIEVMTRSEEEALLARFQTLSINELRKEVTDLGRFAEPKLRRISELAQERGIKLETRNLIQTEIDQAVDDLQ